MEKLKAMLAKLENGRKIKGMKAKTFAAVM